MSEPTALTTVVVDDNEMDRYVARRRFEKLLPSVRVIEAASGDTLMKRVGDDGLFDGRRDGPVLVLLDVNMPGQSGVETARSLQAQVEAGLVKRDVVVVMCSSSENPAEKYSALDIPIVVDYMVKPLCGEDVELLIARCCGTNAMRARSPDTGCG